LFVLIICITLFIAYLIYERIQLNRMINAIPLRITVTGTRGKTGLTRLIASVLRESGRKVLAKTTGSEAQFILPNGAIEPVRRRGNTTILEQKKLLKKAAAVNADCIVCEIMSIHPENHFIESWRIIKPHIIAVTNFYPDHVEAMGKTKDDVASVLFLDIPARSTAFIPEDECRTNFEKKVEKGGGYLVKVKNNFAASLKDLPGILKSGDFSENIDLLYAVCDNLNINNDNIIDGIHKVIHDIGNLKIWEYKDKNSRKTFFLVNGFSANDPLSTFRVIEKVKEIFSTDKFFYSGVFNLRSDRGDRTLQWIEALRNNHLDFFRKIYVVGKHAGIVRRKLKRKGNRIEVIKEKTPEGVTLHILSEQETNSVIFGFGNIEGTGRLLIEYWNTTGTEYGL